MARRAHLYADQVYERAADDGCPQCEWPSVGPHELLSSHRTSEGIVVWTRCSCGAVQARLQNHVIARGKPGAGRGGRQR